MSEPRPSGDRHLRAETVVRLLSHGAHTLSSATYAAQTSCAGQADASTVPDPALKI
jgi:hypothetical protein